MTPPSPNPTAVPRTPRRSRSAAVAVGGVALTVAALWSGLWVLARGRAQAGFEDWRRAEAARGRDWTCPDRAVEGYPFAIRLTCAKPTFHGEVAGRPSSGTLEALRAGVGIGRPRTVRIDLDGPLVLRADDDAYKLLASWSALRLTMDRLPGPMEAGSLDADRLAVTLSPGEADDLNLRADHLAGGAEPAAEAGDKAWRFSASGVSFPTLDGLTGTPEPFAADGRGVLAHADLLAAPTAARLDAWRLAGGRLRLAGLTLSKGEFKGRAEGTLALDDGHRLAGRLDTDLQGFGPLAQRFGIPVAGVKLGGLLGGLLGGRKPDAAPASADAVQLPLTFADGHVAVGPIRTPVRLNPFY